MENPSQLRVKRQLKRAKLFEIQKIIKQIRVLEKKKGTDVQLQKNQRKVVRLVEVLDAIKDLNLGGLAEEVCKVLQDGGTLTTHTHTGGEVSEPTERAKHRLFTNKAFQRIFSTTNRGKTIPHTSAQPKVMLEDTGHAEATNRAYSNNRESSSERMLGDDGGGESELEGQSATSTDTEPVVREYTERVDPTSSDDLLDVEDTNVEMSSFAGLSKTKRKRRRGSVTTGTHIPAADRPDGAANKMESMFVGTLSADNPTAEQKEQSVRMKKAMKNRPGQRTRQKRWEEMFGKKAKHVLEGKKQRGKTRAQTGKQKPIKMNSVTKSTSSHSHSTHHPLGLHPSWEAQKRKKAMEAGIPKFQGQRTVFFDSD